MTPAEHIDRLISNGHTYFCALEQVFSGKSCTCYAISDEAKENLLEKGNR